MLLTIELPENDYTAKQTLTVTVKGHLKREDTGEEFWFLDGIVLMRQGKLISCINVSLCKHKEEGFCLLLTHIKEEGFNFYVVNVESVSFVNSIPIPRLTP